MPCAAADKNNPGIPLWKPLTHFCFYLAGRVNKIELQHRLPSPQGLLLRPSGRWNTRSGPPVSGREQCRACSSLPPFIKPLQVHILPLWDVSKGSLKFPGKHTLHADFHHPHHPDWLLMARLAPINLLSGQMPCAA